MVRPSEVAANVEAYGEWRNRLALRVAAVSQWLHRQDLADADVDFEIRQMLARLHGDKLVVAFVGGIYRGKSELIRAMFFAAPGEGRLPMTPGRATTCPTEILYDASRAPSLRLLPIETRLKDATIEEFRNDLAAWVSFPLDPSDADKISKALDQVSAVKEVPLALAHALGLYEDVEADTSMLVGGHEHVEVPCWRHAILNVPHRLLQQGLVILDTPGPDAPGAEPEHRRRFLSDAHAVVFVAAADTGVSASDVTAWRRDLAGQIDGKMPARLVVLNKIDCLWNEKKPPSAVAAEIDRRVRASAELLDVPPARIFPVSAQKALQARVGGDGALFERSRLGALEDALSRKIVAAKYDVVGTATRAAMHALAAGVRSSLEARQSAIAEQLADRQELRSRNQDVVLHMLERVGEETKLHERGLQRFAALRTVFTQQANALFEVIGLSALHANAGRTRLRIEKSPFTKGVRNAIAEFFTAIRLDFDEAGNRAVELHDMMRAMYTRSAAEQGSEPFTPPPFSMLKYQKEIDRLERAYNQHFNTPWNMLSKAKFSLTQRFFETVASRVKHLYDIANRDVETWLRTVMSPLESHVHEHDLQLKRRLESVQRIEVSNAELAKRIGELERQHEALTRQIGALMEEVAAIDGIVLPPEILPAAAGA